MGRFHGRPTCTIMQNIREELPAQGQFRERGEALQATLRDEVVAYDLRTRRPTDVSAFSLWANRCRELQDQAACSNGGAAAPHP